jgi:adenine-specific DNA-methyltransferase
MSDSLPMDLLDLVEPYRIKVQQLLDKTRQGEMGQFLTPPKLAEFMASMFDQIPEAVLIIDAGAGVGTLSTALVTHLLESDQRPTKISITAFEIDPLRLPGLNATYAECAKLCAQQRILFDYKIRQEDYIEVSVEALKGGNSLFPAEKITCNLAIMNPPYRKISSGSRIRNLLGSIGIETTNLYTAFLWLIIRQLAANGQLVAIVPRSFCNGTYFRNFRADFLNLMAISRIHVFESRKRHLRKMMFFKKILFFVPGKLRKSRLRLLSLPAQIPKMKIW